MILPQLCILALAALTSSAIIVLRRSRSTSSPLEEHEPTDTLTPLELGYLKGDTPGLLRAVLLRLERKGWLVERVEHHATGSTTYFAPATHPPPPSLLRAAELEVWLGILEDPRPRPVDAIDSGPLLESLALFGVQLHRDLAAQGLMHSPEQCAAHDTRRITFAWGVALAGTLMSALLLPTSLAGAIFFLALTWVAWRLIHALGAHPRRTTAGRLVLEVYEDLYMPMYSRRDTWRRFTPKDFDYLRVIFSSF